MAWWAWLLLGWVVLAALLALWLGAAARRIKQIERLEAARDRAPGPPRHRRVS
jgi:hypothetical protein